MTRISFAGVTVTALLAVLLVGCQQPGGMTMEAPERPAELNHLDMFVGTWEATGEATKPGSEETVKIHGTETVEWDADKWVLVSHYDYSIGEKEMCGVDIMRWDPKAKKYCGWSVDNHGGTSTGTGTYDEATHTWHFKGKSHNPFTGKSHVGEGTGKMVDDNTQEWTWTRWDCWKLKKLMEGKSTSRRK